MIAHQVTLVGGLAELVTRLSHDDLGGGAQAMGLLPTLPPGGLNTVGYATHVELGFQNN